VEKLGGEGREGKKREGKGWGAIQCLASGRHRLSCVTETIYSFSRHHKLGRRCCCCCISRLKFVNRVTDDYTSVDVAKIYYDVDHIHISYLT